MYFETSWLDSEPAFENGNVCKTLNFMLARLVGPADCICLCSANYFFEVVLRRPFLKIWDLFEFAASVFSGSDFSC